MRGGNNQIIEGATKVQKAVLIMDVSDKLVTHLGKKPEHSVSAYAKARNLKVGRKLAECSQFRAAFAHLVALQTDPRLPKSGSRKEA